LAIGVKSLNPGVVRWSRARRTAVVMVDGALVLGTGAAAALGGGALAGASVGTAPTPGWTGIQAPLPSSPDAPNGTNPFASFDGESCVSAVFCAAVGDYENGSNLQQGLLEVYQGGTWHAAEAPMPLNADPTKGEVFIKDVSCASVGSCVAVGSYKDSSGHAHAVIETYAGGSWTALEAPSPHDANGTYAFLKDVSCPAPGDCFAIGDYSNGSADVGYIDTLANGAWTSAPAPVPTGSVLQPSSASISCPSPTFCGATETDNFSASSSPVLLDYTGGTWSGVTAPMPAGAASNEGFSGVSCQAGACEASGFYDTSGPVVGQGLLERFAGGGWTAQTAPLPLNHNATTPTSELDGVSCTFDGACTAVGSYSDTNGNGQPLVESIAGGTATPQEAPVPFDAASNPGVVVNAVSCLAGGACTAVGRYATTAGGQGGLIDQLSGGSWTATPAPLPSNEQGGSSQSAGLNAVSCSSRGACAAAGFYYIPTNDEQGLLENYTPPEGYWSGASDGGVFTYGSATFHGSAGNLKLNQPVVGMAAAPGNGGYWLAAADGGIFNYGNAPFYGSTGALKLNKPVVGMAATPDGGGYWLVAADGGIFNYGDAGFYGSTGAIKLNQAIVGMAATPDGHGYWLVAADGGVFNYGDAGFFGSRGGQPLNKPIVGMASTATGNGYWLVASDGGIFTYGDAQFYGSTGAITLNKPIVSMMSTFDGAGYFLVASDGGIFNYGDAGFYGSAGSLHLNKPVVSGAPS
jgi:hypothetical protein